MDWNYPHGSGSSRSAPPGLFRQLQNKGTEVIITKSLSNHAKNPSICPTELLGFALK